MYRFRPSLCKHSSPGILMMVLPFLKNYKFNLEEQKLNQETQRRTDVLLAALLHEFM